MIVEEIGEASDERAKGRQRVGIRGRVVMEAMVIVVVVVDRET